MCLKDGGGHPEDRITQDCRVLKRIAFQHLHGKKQEFFLIEEKEWNCFRVS